jgi:MFS family permease
MRNIALICGAAFLRSMSTGMLGVVLAVYLSRHGLSATWIGAVIAAGLAGSAVATAWISFRVDVLGRRGSLILLATLASFGGVALISFKTTVGLVVMSFIAMLNGMGTDRSAAFAIEQAALPSLVSDKQRTWTLSWYNVVLDTGGALGALCGALPIVLQNTAGLDLDTAYKWVFAGYGVANFSAAGLYILLSKEIEVRRMRRNVSVEISTHAKSIVRRISALFALDAGGGGFLADALLAYWFFQRFGMDERTLGMLFFVVRVLNAMSHLGAAWSLFLLFVPLAPSFPIAAALLLAREALVEMDVPTRQSYLAAMVQPHERVYASGITSLTRTSAWAATSSAAGVLMQYVAFSAPLVLGGSMKVIYDALLYRNFRHLKPPEER